MNAQATGASGWGALLLVIAMACFSVSDAMAKQLSQAFSPNALAWARYATGCLVLIPFVAARPAIWRTNHWRLQLLRAASMLVSALLYVKALAMVPIAVATALGFAAPLFMTLLAVLILRERVTALDWVAVVFGLIGVAIIARPGTATSGWGTLLPILAAFAWSVGIICTRKLAAEPPITQLAFTSLIGAGVLTLFWPGATAAALQAYAGGLAVMGVSWAIGHALTIAAYRFAGAAHLAPFSYSQLLWASLLGFMLFSHIPDGPSIVGMAVIVCSGLLAAYASKSAKTAPLGVALQEIPKRAEGSQRR